MINWRKLNSLASFSPQKGVKFAELLTGVPRTASVICMLRFLCLFEASFKFCSQISSRFAENKIWIENCALSEAKSRQQRLALQIFHSNLFDKRVQMFSWKNASWTVLLLGNSYSHALCTVTCQYRTGEHPQRLELRKRKKDFRAQLVRARIDQLSSN